MSHAHSMIQVSTHRNAPSKKQTKMRNPVRNGYSCEKAMAFRDQARATVKREKENGPSLLRMAGKAMIYAGVVGGVCAVTGSESVMFMTFGGALLGVGDALFGHFKNIRQRIEDAAIADQAIGAYTINNNNPQAPKSIFVPRGMLRAFNGLKKAALSPAPGS
ncbi:MAG: hypothetical protein IPI58_05470 [Alphaproteobacteria bacterium]|nr:MAG: hypothetical protein IPI58_05470 [Alphaproteobacteria bacterium]